MNPTITTTIESLPPELIAHIFTFLDSPAPSEIRLREQPCQSMLSSSAAPLKAVSLVSKLWRAIVLPRLFRHVFWAFDRWDLVFHGTAAVGDGTFDSAGNPTDLPLLSFLRKNGLTRVVDSLTLMVSDRMYGQYRLAEANSSSNTREVDTPWDVDAEWPQEDDLRSLLTDARTRAGWTSRWRQHSARSEDSNWLWELLFDTIDPKRFTIIALPRMLASLLSRMLFLGDAWSFRDQLHILSLDRRTPESLAKWKPLADAIAQNSANESYDEDPETAAVMPGDASPKPAEAAKPSAEPSQDEDKPVKTILFTIRPWTSVLLNEGTSMGVYKTYEYFLRRPPSILGSLLGCEESPNDEPLITSTVRSFSYIAIFPLSSHFNSLVNHLPAVDNLYVQLVPRNDILDNKDEMRNIQPSDLWMERNTCYSLVMRALFGAELGIGWDDLDGGPPDNGWRTLRVFESGDAADKEAWDMAVEYVRMSGSSWTVAADGVLIKGQADGDDQAEEATGVDSLEGHASSPTTGALNDNDPSELELFQGRLEVLAFSGTADLPFSTTGLNFPASDPMAVGVGIFFE